MSFGGYYNNDFYAFFDNEGYIVSSDYSGQQKRVGVSLKKFAQIEKLANDTMEKAEEYQKKLEKFDEYKKILIKHKLIEPELTPDEKIAALSGQIETLTKIVEQLVTKENKTSDTQNNVVVPEIINPPAKTESRGESNGKGFAVGGDGKSFLASK